MRQVLAISFLVIYALATLRPAVLWLDYQIQKDYFSTVLCENRNLPQLNCDGKCVLAKRLKAIEAANPTEESSPEIPQPVQELSLDNHLGLDGNLVSEFVIKSNQIPADLVSASSGLLEMETPPPEKV